MGEGFSVGVTKWGWHIRYDMVGVWQSSRGSGMRVVEAWGIGMGIGVGMGRVAGTQ